MILRIDNFIAVSHSRTQESSQGMPSGAGMGIY